MKYYPGRLGLQQRVLPTYRVPFIDLLASRCEGGLSVLAGSPLPMEGIHAGAPRDRTKFFKARNFHFTNPSSSFYFCFQKGILNWLKKWRPDALVIEANPRYLSSLLAIRWMHHHRKPVIGWGLGIPRSGNKIEYFFRRAFLSLLDGVIAYSQRGVDEYRQLGLKKVFLAYNASTPKPSWFLPKRREKPGEKLQVLFVGRIQARKRLDILLRACQRLPESIQPQLVIVGDGPALEDARDLAEKYYPQTLFTGALYGGDLAAHFLSADLFALPGTGGLAIQEAMSYGLPVIVAKGDGTQDDLVHPGNGWQVPPGDLDAFSSILAGALSDLSGLRRKGAESYRIVSEQVNIQTMADMFIDAINKTVHNSVE